MAYNICVFIYEKCLSLEVDVDEYINEHVDTLLSTYNNYITENNCEVNYDYYKSFSVSNYKAIIDIVNKDSAEQQVTINTFIPPFKFLMSNICPKYYGYHRYGWKNVIGSFLKYTYNEEDPFHFQNPHFEWVSYALEKDLEYYEDSKAHYSATSMDNVDTSKVYNQMKCFIFDDWLDFALSWNYPNKNFSANVGIISFLHDPPIPLDEADSFRYNETILCKLKYLLFNEDNFKKHKDQIQLLITLTDAHRESLLESGHLSKSTVIRSTLHPLEIGQSGKFDLEAYIANSNKKIYLIGWWLRRFETFLSLKNSQHKKVVIVKNVEGHWVTDYVYYELRKTLFPSTYMKMNTKDPLSDDELMMLKYNNITITGFLPEDEYDDIFRNNLVYLDFYATSANNALLECIITNTPVLVIYNKAVVEYLGEDYPFYFKTLEEAEEKLNNIETIKETHYYLKNMDKSIFSYKHFANTLISYINEL